MHSNSLSHHGVKGQRWGVRRYQNKDGSLTDAGAKRYANKQMDIAEKYEDRANRSKTSIGKMMNLRRAASAEYKATRRVNVANAKGVGDKLSNLVGEKNAATRAMYTSRLNAKQAEVAKSRFGKAYLNAASKNNKSLSDYHTKIVNSKTIGERIANKYVGSLKMPVTSLGGRRSTLGRETAIAVLTSGLGNLTLDAVYASSQRKKRKDSKRNNIPSKNEMAEIEAQIQKDIDRGVLY